MTSEELQSQALKKAMHYCAYQERCTYDVINKLKELEIPSSITEKVIEQLIEDNFVNNERYCKLFATGKFKYNKWGKLKIQAALRQKMLPDHLIEKGLAEISESDYKGLLHDLYQAKIKNMELAYEEKIKVMQYLVSKGFEKEMILKYINSPKNK